jgi:hypothetical protein
MTVPTDPEHLVVEVDATSSIAVHRTGLGRELTHALQAAGLPTTIHVNSIGGHQGIETRSWGNALHLGAEAGRIVIYQLRSTSRRPSLLRSPRSSSPSSTRASAPGAARPGTRA